MSKNTNDKSFKRPAKKDQEFEQRVIEIARVTRVMAGGKRMRFRACVVIGDMKGRVGFGIAKGADVTIAINKAVDRAKKTMVRVNMVNGTIPHEVRLRHKAVNVLLKPAPQGTGVVAGGPTRAVVELAGYKNVVIKMIGSRSKINNVQTTFKALQSLKQPKGK
ncbi:30S ribosomal protein S5 [Patescibacteria group bacterium]|nr:30S ribosomal protein S5 [Patescibacteria group bacterium]MBU1890348.1 30S ribosomal protein S5 [Patescibacteria group bacterium]